MSEVDDFQVLVKNQKINKRKLVINQLGRSIPIHLPCIGYHNVFNALAAAAAGYWAGLTLEQIMTGLETFRTVQMRLQSIKLMAFE